MQPTYKVFGDIGKDSITKCSQSVSIVRMRGLLMRHRSSARAGGRLALEKALLVPADSDETDDGDA